MTIPLYTSADNLLSETLSKSQNVFSKKYTDEELSKLPLKEVESLCLKKNVTQSCIFAGKKYSNFNFEYKDYVKAENLFSRGCELKDAESCIKLGELYELKVIEKKGNFDTIAAYEKACDLNEGRGCSYLGYLYDNGQGVKQDYKTAKEYYEKACELNEGFGC